MRGRFGAEGDWLYERARNLDGTQRSPRDNGDQARLRRAAAAGLEYEEHDGASPRCIGGARGNLLPARAARSTAAADDELRASRPAVRSRLRPERGASGDA